MSFFKIVPLVKRYKYTISLELNADLKAMKASLKKNSNAEEEAPAENTETITENAL